MKFNRSFEINGNTVGEGHKTYFIADVAANHDGDLERAKDLIYMCAEAGADAAKFQHFQAKTIVSDHGFKNLGSQQSHQASWDKSVFEVYQDASLNFSWTPTLRETCEKAGIDFFTSPYSLDLVDQVEPFVSAYKVGSGDITWIEIIEKMAQKDLPLLLACGASSLEDVVTAVEAAAKHSQNLCLMQCNTNYTASLENFKYINLNVLNVFKEMFPGMVLGLSDHTPGHSTVLGAVALGATVIEKHFTDSNDRVGPDHTFSMNPHSWREMVDRTRELEYSLGTGLKKVEGNETETVVLQRRSIRLKKDISSGSLITKDDLEVLRPCPVDGIVPYQMDMVLGKTLNKNKAAGEHLCWGDLG